ncbi:MAG TPA: hypothetical protein VIR79_07460 [Nitrospira sp.]
MEEGYSISEITIYLAAVVGLLGLWLFHQMQVRAGRIQAVDLFDRSLVRMYLYMTFDEKPVCDVCAKAHGRVFLSSWTGKKHFSPLDGPCHGNVPCQGGLVGLYGGWLEAREIVARLQKASKKAVVRLSPEEVRKLVKGPWKKSVSADTDRVAVHMLEALCDDRDHVDVAIEGYRFVIAHAKEPRHVPLIVPASLRLTSLLLRVGREEEARQAIEQCERLLSSGQLEGSSPSTEQRQLLEDKKALLWKRQSLQVSA